MGSPISPSSPATKKRPLKKASPDNLTAKAINTIRFLAVDAVEKAKSGHPGTPMALAPLGYLLFTKIMKHNPKNPEWVNRDRFVLSAGHASMLPARSTPATVGRAYFHVDNIDDETIINVTIATEGSLS